MPISKRTREQLVTGVYCWINNANGKVYVGSTIRSFNGRRNGHLSKLRKGTSRHVHLQRAWDKYGEESFEWLVLWRCLPDECIEWEQWWIDRLQAADREHGYNTIAIAGNTREAMSARTKLIKIAKEAKTKISEAAKRQWDNPLMR